jgi:1,2-diacylglycerol-3-alpha-glucose alpha-1,2-galactosyltransferase
MSKKVISVLSRADSVDGQGVGSAYVEQVNLLQKGASDLFEMRINKKGKADLIHVHTVNPEFYHTFAHAKSPTVMYCHVLPDTLDGSIKLPKLFFGIFKRYLVSFYTHADYVVVVNPIFIEPLIKLGVASDRVVYIPNFVDHNTFRRLSDDERNDIRRKYAIEEKAFVVLGVGQVQTRKGVKDFVEVAKMNPTMQFVWAGGFSFKGITDGYKELKAIMDNPPSNVKFLGIVPRKDMNEIYNLADVLFMPSYNELFPMAILEAVNSNTPLLLRDLDLYKNILFGDYLSGNTNEDFASILNKLAADSAYFAKAEGYSQNIASYYTAEHVLKIWIDFYTKVINDKDNILKTRKARIKKAKAIQRQNRRTKQ